MFHRYNPVFFLMNKQNGYSLFLNLSAIKKTANLPKTLFTTDFIHLKGLISVLRSYMTPGLEPLDLPITITSFALKSKRFTL